MSTTPAQHAIPRTLADALRGWDDDSLAALLLARPDLARPAPVDVGQLAARVGGRSSVALAVDRLDTAHLTVVEALARLDEPVGGADVARVVNAEPETLHAVLGRLRALALLWGQDDDLRLVRSAREVLSPHPAGLGPGLRTLLLGLAPARLSALAADLGLPVAGDPTTTASRVAGAYADEGWAQARVDEAAAAGGADALRLLDRLADGPASGRLGQVPDDVRLGSATSALEHLLARGLLVGTDARTVTLPREIGLLRRGGHTTREPVDRAPALGTAPVDPGRVDRVGAGAAFDVVRRVELVLESWGAAPPDVLRSGGVGVREVRALAAAIHLDVDQTGFLVELARAAALLAPGDDPDRGDVWLPTGLFDRWRERPPAQRWAALAQAWLRTPRATGLVGGRDENDRPVNALAPDLERGAAATVRAATLDVLSSLPSGTAMTSAADVVAQVAWARPRRRLLRELTVLRTITEAGWLGVSAMGALTSAGRALVGGADPAPLVEALLPAPVDHVLLQADLTAIAPGPLEPEVGRGLALMADVESRGGATVFRFSASSVRRALDAGWPATQLHAFLDAHSRTPVPQPLTYLIDDSARRHGRLRVGGAAVYVRSDDPAELDTLLADASLAGLRLRRIAPTVALSDAPADRVLMRLRAAQAAPVLEGADGRNAEIASPVRRSAVPSQPLTTVSALGPDDAAAAVAALRAGERARAARPSGERAAPGPTRLVEQLRAAVEDRQPVWLAYLDETGTVSERVVDPVGVDGGRLTAYDHRSSRTRSFALHRISRVAAAGRPSG
jgi:hypothetical protein